MITVYSAAAAILFLAVGWFGGRSWMKLIWPEIHEPLALVYLPLIITGAVLIVVLVVLDRAHVPITFWSILSVVLLNIVIPEVFVFADRRKHRS